jgi:hypothetical protein
VHAPSGVNDRRSLHHLRQPWLMEQRGNGTARFPRVVPSVVLGRLGDGTNRVPKTESSSAVGASSHRDHR